MELVLNEISIKNISTEDDFFEFCNLLSKINDLNVTFFKKSTFFNEETNINNSNNHSIKYKIQDLLRESRHDTILKFKSLLFNYNTPPHWDVNTKQSSVHYYYSNITELVGEYGAAEAIERDCSVFSFYNKDISVKKTDLYDKLEKEETLNNFFTLNQLLSHLLSENKISLEIFLKFFKFKLFLFNSDNISFITSSYSTSEIFYILKSFIQNDEFNSIEEFSEFSTPARNKYSHHSFARDYPAENFHKFRLNRKIRCWGYKKQEKFVPCFINFDHD